MSRLNYWSFRFSPFSAEQTMIKGLRLSLPMHIHADGSAWKMNLMLLDINIIFYGMKRRIRNRMRHCSLDDEKASCVIRYGVTLAGKQMIETRRNQRVDVHDAEIREENEFHLYFFHHRACPAACLAPTVLGFIDIPIVLCVWVLLNKWMHYILSLLFRSLSLSRPHAHAGTLFHFYLVQCTHNPRLFHAFFFLSIIVWYMTV